MLIEPHMETQIHSKGMFGVAYLPGDWGGLNLFPYIHAITRDSGQWVHYRGEASKPHYGTSAPIFFLSGNTGII